MWIVHLAGVEQRRGVPYTPVRTPYQPSLKVVRNAYIFIDATTGEFLHTQWTE